MNCASSATTTLYRSDMPRLWERTISEHRAEVRSAILSAIDELITQEGLRSVTMSAVAEQSGIGRATLYRYFPSVEAILLAWHEARINEHLAEIEKARDDEDDPVLQITRVLEAYGRILRERRAHPEHIADLLHRDGHVPSAHNHLVALLADVISRAVERRTIRSDVPAAQLANYCVNALGAAKDLATDEELNTLVHVVLSGLRVGH